MTGAAPDGRPHRALHDLLDTIAHAAPDRPAVRDRNHHWSYRELTLHSYRLAHWLLARGVARGDRVLVRHPNDARLVALVYAVSRVGAVLVPVNHQTPRHPYGLVLRDAAPVLAVTATAEQSPDRGGPGATTSVTLAQAWAEAALLPDTQPPPGPAGPQDLAVLFYTSGTTAAPKGVMCPHQQILFAAAAIADRLGYRAEDRVYCWSPFSFDYGLYQVFLAALGGSQLLLAPPGEDPGVLRRVREWGATVLPLVPSMAVALIALAARDRRATRLRLFTSTGAALAPATLRALRENFPGARIQLMFGITECKRVSVLEPDGDLRHPGSAGRPLDGTRVEVLGPAAQVLPPGEVGEFVVSGPHLARGYWRAPDLTADRFRPDPATGEVRLFTGDFGHLDADGHLHVQGRRDEVFKSRGVRTSAAEIEAAALDVPGVRAAAVIPPDGHRGSTLVVVAATPAARLLRELRERLEPAKVPAACHLVPELPLTANGKVDRPRLAALIATADAPASAPTERTRSAADPR
ncbi:class I adenylate-forming enzyme family protein [Streptacidiphilus sp. P02-A3a]|uniref:class I adenylate-forming enzyme family protein n=1 Tax=Streptacidiphilus sp. P02-A3a TaxID=2704468 RepID=UPI001CDB9FB7|nr:class I adenylate-forming enzyme family protein [Streptacidiphilus sp. P02-A3a]